MHMHRTAGAVVNAIRKAAMGPSAVFLLYFRVDRGGCLCSIDDEFVVGQQEAFETGGVGDELFLNKKVNELAHVFAVFGGLFAIDLGLGAVACGLFAITVGLLAGGVGLVWVVVGLFVGRCFLVVVAGRRVF